MEHIFAGLNEKQIEAVKAIEGPVLVISGPGSGKTKCLTHRIAYLISNGVRPEHILAVTFTNKAAQEVKERVSALTKLPIPKYQFGVSGAVPTIGTFHSIGLRILRREAEKLGYGAQFNIWDSEDQRAIVKKIMLQNEIDTKRYNPASFHNKISKLKTELIFPEDYNPSKRGSDFMNYMVAQTYKGYQAEMMRMNGVDFDDLISLPVKIFQKHPEILIRYQNLWKYILVDEYQDTSHDQYTLITMLAAKHKNLFCIGDDAQSIYMFREADIRNILNFQKDYPDGKVILLEQNYRSTGTIIAAAQAVIANNKNQFTKELWTANPKGELLLAQETSDERGEAEFIVEKTNELILKRYKPEDIAILYRTHAQSRAIEEAFISHGLPYKIVGGIKFYDRKEIKDVLAYLRFLHNPKDGVSFERLANVPTRGIGPTTIDKILVAGGSNLIEGIRRFATDENLKEKRYTALVKFADLMEDLHRQSQTAALSLFMRTLIKKVGYEEYLRSTKDKLESAEERIENLKELFTVAKPFDSSGPEGLGQFLERIALLQETDKTKEEGRRTTMMTMHASKGLEFPVVFVVGMEEGIFPHSRTLFSAEELEEERRLCYVALTRAKEKVFISFAKFRRIFGSAQANLPSRFLSEIPSKLLTWQFMKNDYEDEDTISYEA